MAQLSQVQTKKGSEPYMLNTRNEEKNTVFYSYSACFMNTFNLNMYVSMSYTGIIRRNMLFIWREGLRGRARCVAPRASADAASAA